jgi:hypothetical protein
MRKVQRKQYVAVVAILMATTAGCSAPGAKSGAQPGAQPEHSHRKGGAARVASAAPGAVPIPLPPGRVTARDGATGRWSVLLAVPGSAAEAQRSAVDFYAHRGFHRDSDSALHGQGYAIMMIAENRDHASTGSNLTIVVNRRQP